MSPKVPSPASRYRELVAAISEADRRYYVEDAPTLTDAEYDALRVELNALEARIASLSEEIEALATEDEACKRLMTVPGIGIIISSAVVSAIGTGGSELWATISSTHPISGREETPDSRRISPKRA